MMDQTENPDAAWLWMEFLSQPEILARLTYETEGTLLPPLTSLLEGDEITEEKPVLQGFIDLMECGVASTVSNPKFPRVETILNEELGKAMYGEQTRRGRARQRRPAGGGHPGPRLNGIERHTVGPGRSRPTGSDPTIGQAKGGRWRRRSSAVTAGSGESTRRRRPSADVAGAVGVPLHRPGRDRLLGVHAWPR